ncbi:hypothetical protein Tco_0647505 [Tanacetum coccineum]
MMCAILKLDQNINDSRNATQADKNTQLGHNLGGSTASISVGQGTKGRSDVQTGKLLTFVLCTGRASNGADVDVSLEFVQAIRDRFPNSVYGFFLGKHITYLVVENNVKNTWSKYGLVKSLMNSANGLFFFKFSSKDGIDAMLENSPSFSEDGLSAIATKLATPLMLDSYTSAMCTKSWGRSSFARTMIELRVDVELKDTIMVDVPKLIVENDDDLGTNGRNCNLDDKGADSLSSPTDTPVNSSLNSDSKSKVEEVFNENASFMASTSLKSDRKNGYGTKSLLEQ